MSKKDWQLLTAYQATGLTPEEVERVKRERDAYFDVMRDVRFCGICKHKDVIIECNAQYCKTCEKVNCVCAACEAESQWQWRGVKEENNA